MRPATYYPSRPSAQAVSRDRESAPEYRFRPARRPAAPQRGIDGPLNRTTARSAPIVGRASPAHRRMEPLDFLQGVFRAFQVVLEILSNTAALRLDAERIRHFPHRLRHRPDNRSANPQCVFKILTGSQRPLPRREVQENRQRPLGDVERRRVADFPDTREGIRRIFPRFSYIPPRKIEVTAQIVVPGFSWFHDGTEFIVRDGDVSFGDTAHGKRHVSARQLPKSSRFLFRQHARCRAPRVCRQRYV